MYACMYACMFRSSPYVGGTTDDISSSRWSRLLEGRHWRCPNNRKLSRYVQAEPREMTRWNQMECVCMHTKGSPLAAPELYECYLTVQKTESPQAAPREMMRWSQMEQKDRHCRCPNNRKLSGHRRCSEKWRNEMKWEEKNGYSMTEQKTESPQAEPKEMMRWTQTKYVTGSPLVKPFAAQKVFRCLSKY